MALLPIFEGRDGDGAAWSVSYVFDRPSLTVTGLSITNNARHPLAVEFRVAGQVRQLTVARGASRTLDFPAVRGLTEPTLVGRTAKGFVVSGLEYVRAGLV